MHWNKGVIMARLSLLYLSLSISFCSSYRVVVDAEAILQVIAPFAALGLADKLNHVKNYGLGEHLTASLLTNHRLVIEE
jgi:hypothetical protein